MGLPTDRPIVMAGHDASVWHGGILAKVFAVDAAARAARGASAWVVVDEDETEFATIRVPMRDAGGGLRAAEWRLCDPPGAGIAAASLPTFEAKGALPGNGNLALESVRLGARAIVDALNARRGESNAARQVTAATFDLVSAFVETPRVIFASEMMRTRQMRDVVARMGREPGRVVEAYNAAVKRFGAARVAPLRAEGGRWELPLWRLEAGRARRRVFSDEVAGGRFEGLAPRALLMTGIMRLAGCECFVHGVGGVGYDRATEMWFKDWLGEALAPMVLTTADVILPLASREATEAEAARSAWRAHHARHDPALVKRADLAAEKGRLVARVKEEREANRAALPAYRELQAMLARYRESERGAIEGLAREAEAVKAALAEAAVAKDRTWAFPLHGSETITSLKKVIEEEFGTRA
jgi:hypothetical protein